MDTETVNRWLTLAANIGVLAGIVLLAYELNQNRKMMMAETHRDIALAAMEIAFNTSHDREMVEIMVKNRAGKQLTPVEATQYRWRNFGQFRRYQSDYYLYTSGFYDDDEYRALKTGWRTSLNRNPLIGENWCIFRENMPQSFRRELDALFHNKPC